MSPQLPSAASPLVREEKCHVSISLFMVTKSSLMQLLNIKSQLLKDTDAAQLNTLSAATKPHL